MENIGERVRMLKNQKKYSNGDYEDALNTLLPLVERWTRDIERNHVHYTSGKYRVECVFCGEDGIEKPEDILHAGGCIVLQAQSIIAALEKDS